MSISFLRLGKFSGIISSNMFSSLSFPCGDSHTMNARTLDVLGSLLNCPYVFISLFSIQFQLSPLLCLPAHWSAPLYLISC